MTQLPVKAAGEVCDSIAPGFPMYSLKNIVYIGDLQSRHLLHTPS